MLFSAPKSKRLPIGPDAQQSPSVFMKGAPIPQVRTHKHLTFNSSLTWNDHNSHLYTTCARMTGIPRRLDIDGSIPSSSMKKIYTAVIRPPIEYACAVWSGGPTQRLQRLLDHETPFRKKHGIMLPPLQKRFNYHTLVLLYRIREKLAPDHLFSLLPSLISITSGYSLRKHSYPVPSTKNLPLSIAFCPAMILWNTLPFDIQSSKYFGMFKSKLKTHLSL